ncbi:MAG: ABC transporter ATP-binding protein [Acidimicrobiales bacterium]
MGWLQGGVEEGDKLDGDATRAVLRRAWGLLHPYRRTVVITAALITAQTLTIVAGPLLFKVGIDRGILRGDLAQLNKIVAVYLVVAASGYFLQRLAIRGVAKAGESALRDLRVSVFDRMLAQSLGFYDRQKAGVLVARMTADVDSLSELTQYGLLMFLTAGITLGLVLVTLALLSWKLLLVCLVSMPFVVVASIRFQRRSNVAYLRVRDSVGATLSGLQEGIAGVRVVQAFAREDLEASRFARTNRELFQSHMESVKIAAWYLPIVEMAGYVAIAATIMVGGLMARDGTLSIGTVAAFLLLLSFLFEPVQLLSQLFNVMQSATASLSKLFGLIDMPLSVVEADTPVELAARGDLCLEGITFSYDHETPVLHDVSISVPAGGRLALVGSTGAGKSTVAKLMARFYDPTSGVVSFGGVDLRDASIRSLRDRVVVVPQEGFLFNGTIRDNVRLGRPDATDFEVDKAAELVGIADYFAGFEQGLDTEVRERGSRLSAGERQLVSLARAALADPAVLVLDEATSSLDPGTEVIVETAMESLMQGRTVVVIAHRLSTARRCDRIGVVEGGQLVELDTHDTLVAAGGRYAELFARWEEGLAAKT